MKQMLGRMFLLATFVLSALGVSGCGGGGGTAAAPAGPSPTGTTVSGTALAGAPLIGFAFLKDANGTKKGPVTIDNTGNFSFDVTGLQPPFILQADGTAGANSYRLCSMSTGGATANTANINPMTNLAVAAATGKDPTAVFLDPVANNIKTSINDAAIADAIAKIKTMLAPILAAYNATNVDPLKDSVVANNAGMDGVFDVVKINVSADTAGAAQVSIDNRLTGAPILSQTSVSTATTNAAQTATTITTQTTGLSADAANLAAITARLQLLATELGKATPNLDPFFAVNYGINSGRDRAQAIADLTPPGTITGLSTINVVKKTANGASFDYEISFVAFFSDGSSGAPDDNFIFTLEGTTWKLKGNGFKFDSRVRPQAFKWIDATGTATVKSGLQVQIEDPGLKGLASATVTGPGLPAGGLRMTQVGLGVTFFQIDPVQQDPTLQALTDQPDFFPLSDNTITSAFAATAAPFTYTFTLKDQNGATLETRTRQLAVGPLLSSALDATFFPTISGFASHAMSLVAGKSSVTFSFALPTAFKVQELRANLNFFDNTTSGFLESNILLSATSATLVGQVSAAPANAWVSLQATDANRRRFETVWIFK